MNPHSVRSQGVGPPASRSDLRCMAPLALALLFSLAPAVALSAVVDINPSMDNMIVQENVGLSNGAGSWLIAGNNNQGTSGQSRRALIVDFTTTSRSGDASGPVRYRTLLLTG